jgi:plasmid stability protein
LSDVLVRGLSPKVVQRLKARARRNGRSLQREAKQILETAADVPAADVATILKRWSRRFASRRLASSVEMIREDRKR